jgi:hypothetical protein
MMFVNKLSQQSYLPYADAPIDEMFDIISQSEAIKVSRKGIIGRLRIFLECGFSKCNKRKFMTERHDGEIRKY